MKELAFAAALLLAACGGKVRNLTPDPDAGPDAAPCEPSTAPYIGFPDLSCLEDSE